MPERPPLHEFLTWQPWLLANVAGDAGIEAAAKAAADAAKLFAVSPPANNEADFRESEIQLMRPGTFNFHGRTIRVDSSLFDEFADNFERGAKGTEPRTGMPKPLPIYKDHLPYESYGRMFSLRHDENGLFGRVRWNVLGQNLILNEVYDQISVEFIPGYIDSEGNRWGAVLRAASLVNDPLIKNMVSVRFSEEDGSPSYVFTLKVDTPDNKEHHIHVEPEFAGVIRFSERTATMNEEDRNEEEQTLPPADPPASDDSAAELEAARREIEALKAEKARLALKASEALAQSKKDSSAVEEAREAAAEKLRQKYIDLGKVTKPMLFFEDGTPTPFYNDAKDAPDKFVQIASNLSVQVAELGEQGTSTVKTSSDDDAVKFSEVEQAFLDELKMKDQRYVKFHEELDALVEKFGKNQSLFSEAYISVGNDPLLEEDFDPRNNLLLRVMAFQNAGAANKELFNIYREDLPFPDPSTDASLYAHETRNGFLTPPPHLTASEEKENSNG